MSTDAFTVRYHFDDAQIQRIASSVVRERRIFFFAPWIGLIIFIIPTLYSFWTETGPLHNRILSSFTKLLLGCFFIFLPLLTVWMTKRQLRLSVMRGHEVTWRITPDRLLCDGGEMFRNEFSWSVVHSATESASGFLLYTSRAIANWLPFDGFDSPDHVDAFRKLLVSRVPKFQRKA